MPLATVGATMTSNDNYPGSFTQFIQNVNNAKYSDYAHLATTKVQNEQEFAKMRQHIIELYAGIQVDSTYMTGGQVIDCVVTSTQHGYESGSTAPNIKNVPNSKIDQPASMAASSCKQGTIPMQRVTLDTLVQFATLQGFLSQGKSAPPGIGK